MFLLNHNVLGKISKIEWELMEEDRQLMGRKLTFYIRIDKLVKVFVFNPAPSLAGPQRVLLLRADAGWRAGEAETQARG